MNPQQMSEVPGEVAKVDISKLKKNVRPGEVVQHLQKMPNGILVMQDGSPLDFDNWERQIGRDPRS